MTPAARTQAAIELLSQIEAEGLPADAAVRAYTRQRRYMGSKDRRAVADLVFATIRARLALDWRIAQAGGSPSPRLRVLAGLARDDFDAMAGLCDGSTYGPPALGEDERSLLTAVAGDDAEPPANVPAWLEPEMRRRFGAAMEEELVALDGEAALDLRVAAGHDRDAILAQLTSLGIAAEATPLSPHGIRVSGRPRIDGLPAWQDGAIEIQDEGAQLVALLCEAAQARCVVDYCAGAGGKTLALAALAPDARLIACDNDAKRLGRLAPRLARAGIAGVESHVLGADEPLAEALAERVLVDVPCSGSGAWRRNPDDRHRLTADMLAAYTARQDEILAAAAPLVAPAGRLIYATCSLLPRENEDRIDGFLAAHSNFKRLDVRDVWRRVLAAPPPDEGPDILLTPHRHGTDGFYVAVLERAAQT